ncbi:ribosome silencing factor [Thermocrinis sp.]
MELLNKVVHLLEEKKAEDIVVLDVSGLTNISDYFVIATANSPIHARALTDHIVETLGKEGITPLHIEGMDNAHWILVDFMDIIVHIFQKEWREYYDIEWLYSNAKRVEV